MHLSIGRARLHASACESRLRQSRLSTTRPQTQKTRLGNSEASRSRRCHLARTQWAVATTRALPPAPRPALPTRAIRKRTRRYNLPLATSRRAPKTAAGQRSPTVFPKFTVGLSLSVCARGNDPRLRPLPISNAPWQWFNAKLHILTRVASRNGNAAAPNPKPIRLLPNHLRNIATLTATPPTRPRPQSTQSVAVK